MNNNSTLLKVKKLHPAAIIPKRGSRHASGYDLFACIDGDAPMTISRNPQKVRTGIAIEIPEGYDVQVRPRSGLSARGVGVTFGTIDSDYRGEIMVTMYVFGDAPSFQISHGDRIAQMVVSRLADVSIEEAEELSETDRGSGGHGSTGIK